MNTSRSNEPIDPTVTRGSGGELPRRAWLQVDFSLFMQEGDRRPYVPWTAIQGQLERWRATAHYQRSFFMHKPPGLRMRFWGEALDERLAPDLMSWLRDLEERNAIRTWRFGIYEPEVFRFGGAHGMDVAHDQFDRDSRIAFAYRTLPAEVREALPGAELSLLIMQDLFARCVEDGAEVWDVWQRLGDVVREAARHAGAAAASSPRSGDPSPPARLPSAAKALLDRAAADNERIAERLDACLARGGLTIGPRAWLTEVCIFHWNRLALSTDELRPLVERALAFIDGDADA